MHCELGLLIVKRLRLLAVALLFCALSLPAGAIYPYSRVASSPTVSHGSLLVTTPGAGTWTVPAGVTSATFRCWAAGGGGLRTSFSDAAGGGGFAGASSISVTPGATVFFTVGAAGTVGITGGNSWVNAAANAQPAASSSTTIGCAAAGGAPGGGGGAGGTGLTYNSSQIHTGGNAAIPAPGNVGGGGGAGSGGNGGNGSTVTGGTGGTPDGGAGGFAAGAATAPGGGGGATASGGTAGANGQISIVW